MAVGQIKGHPSYGGLHVFIDPTLGLAGPSVLSTRSGNDGRFLFLFSLGLLQRTKRPFAALSSTLRPIVRNIICYMAGSSSSDLRYRLVGMGMDNNAR